MVIVILGILVKMAIPHYRSYVVTGCRTDAMVALEKIANEQAQHYFDFNGYASTIEILPYPAISEGRHYYLSTRLIDGDSNSFEALAQPSDAGDCLPQDDYQFRINHIGKRERKPPGEEWVANWN